MTLLPTLYNGGEKIICLWGSWHWTITFQNLSFYTPVTLNNPQNRLETVFSGTTLLLSSTLYWVEGRNVTDKYVKNSISTNFFFFFFNVILTFFMSIVNIKQYTKTTFSMGCLNNNSKWKESWGIINWPAPKQLLPRASWVLSQC